MGTEERNIDEFLNSVATQDNPIDALRLFLERESRFEKARQIGQMRFVGYVLELGYEAAKIITSDPYKLAVGGDPARVVSNHDPQQSSRNGTTFHVA